MKFCAKLQTERNLWTGMLSRDIRLQLQHVYMQAHNVKNLLCHVRQKFLTRRTPFVEKITPRNPQFLHFLNSKSIFA